MALPKRILEPAVICVYGPSGIGKTTDLLYSFPNAPIVAAPGALKPAGWIGFVPKRIGTIQTLEQLPTLLAKAKVAPRKDPADFAAIGVDDMSLLADATIAALEKKTEGWALWGRVRDTLLDLRTTARNLGCHIVFTAHESDAKDRNGRLQRIGPRLPGRMPEDFPVVCDAVLRAGEGQTRIGWKGVYSGRISPGHYAKDRDNIAFDGAPMNLAELLRAGGFFIPRLPELAWQEDVVARLADHLEKLLDKEDLIGIRDVAKVQAPKIIAEKYSSNLGHIVWTIRDAVDRAVIRCHHKRTAFDVFG